MAAQMIVDSSSQLQEFRDTSHQPRQPLLRFVAKIISYVFHPLFIPVYLVMFLIAVHPYFFGSGVQNAITVLQFFVMYTFFPLVTVLLAKALGFIDTIYLKTQKERIIPFIACEVYYFWMVYVLRHQPQFSGEVVQLAMAIFIASSLGLIANIYCKVSMHAMSMGIVVAFMFVLAFTQAERYTLYLSIALVVAGLVCTARFIVSDHTSKEIYLGLLVGVFSQILAVWADAVLP